MGEKTEMIVIGNSLTLNEATKHGTKKAPKKNLNHTKAFSNIFDKRNGALKIHHFLFKYQRNSGLMAYISYMTQHIPKLTLLLPCKYFK